MLKYEAYKDSGAAWIGNVPSTWEVDRLKKHLKRTDEKNPGGVQVLSLYRELGIVPKDSRDDNHNVTSEDTSKYKYVQPGDFVVNKMKAWQGSVAVSDYEGIVSPAYYVYKFLDDCFHKRYFHYLIRSCYKEEFMRLSAGIRIGQWDLSSDDLDCVLVLLPTKEEQEAIADFLDKKVDYIDSIISEAKASIEEYKAWKASIIYEAVTRGLDPDVEMKDSGVEWIGEIPSSWIIRRGKNVLTLLERPVKDDDDVITCFRDGEVTLRKKRREEGFTISLQEVGYQGIEPGDLVVHGMDGFAGAIGVSDSRGKGTPVLNVMDSQYNKKYLMYYLRAAAIKDVFMSLSTGIRIRSCDLRWNKLSVFPFVLPNYREQDEIVKYLDSKCQNIIDLIREKELLITDLESYKKSLIFEIVTGKRKVV